MAAGEADTPAAADDSGAPRRAGSGAARRPSRGTCRTSRRTQVSGRCSGDSERGSKHQEVGADNLGPLST